MTYKRYEKYKSSRIGDIPEKWILTKLKYTTDEPFMYGANESAELDDRELPRYIRITDIDDNGNLKDKTYKSMELNKAREFLLFDKDILFARSGATVGKTYMYSKQVGEACFAGYLIRYRHNRKVLPEYINYFTKSIDYSDWIRLNTIQATIQNVSAEKYKNLEVPLPNISEQKIIVNFLDKKTTEIDNLIKDKENLIELLKEQRQAIISEAVTKGLDKNISMKDSGVEWIGNIPKQWDITKVKYVCNINKLSLQENTQGEFSFKYIDIGSVNSYGEVSNVEEVEFANAPSRARRIIKSGDILVSTVRTYLRAITSFELVSEDIICSTGFAVLSPNSNIESKYLGYLMRSTKYIDEIVSRSTGVSYPSITATQIGNLECILPPIAEQNIIIKKIDEKLNKIDSLISDIKVGINNLKDYKQSLISEVVTGKINILGK